jgi:hypothetical protein
VAAVGAGEVAAAVAEVAEGAPVVAVFHDRVEETTRDQAEPDQAEPDRAEAISPGHRPHREISIDPHRETLRI